MDPRIKTREVRMHDTPDGKSFEDPKEAERHLARLDAERRERRIRERLEQLFWEDKGLHDVYEHGDLRFVDEAYRLLDENRDLVRMLLPHLDALTAMWGAREA